MRGNSVFPFRAFLLACMLLLSSACEPLLSPSKYATVTVSVVTRSGEPVPAAPVELYTGVRAMGYASTDDAGMVSFHQVPVGVYGVRVVPGAGFAALESVLRVPQTTVQDNISVTSDTLINVKFVLLKRGDGTVSVEVKDETGAPVAGVRTTLYDPFTVHGSVNTDAAGRATFTAVPFGVYGVTITRPSLYLDVNESPALYKDEIVVEGGSSQLVPIAIAKCTGSIAVSVKDQGAQAVAGYPLTLYTAKSVTQDGVTGADGVFRSGVIACDEYGVSLKASAGYVLTPGRGKTFVDGLVVHRGTALSAALTVQSCTATLAVSATDAAGLPVAGARFTLYTASSFLSTLNSDAGGRATFPVPCGQDVGVNVVPPAGYTVTSGRGSSYFDGINLSNGSTAARTFILGRQ